MGETRKSSSLPFTRGGLGWGDSIMSVGLRDSATQPIPFLMTDIELIGSIKMRRFSIASLSAFALVVTVPFINQVPEIAPIWQSTSAVAQSNNQKPQLELRLEAKKRVIAQDQQGKQVKTWEPVQSKDSVKPGDLLQYTSTASNKGDKPIKNVTLNQLIPKEMVYVLDSTKVSAKDAKITYSIDNQLTFVENPTIQVTRNGKKVTEPAPASAYTHIRILVPSVAGNATVTATYQTQVR